MSEKEEEIVKPKATRRTFLKGLGAGAVVAAAAVAGVEEYRIAQLPPPPAVPPVIPPVVKPEFASEVTLNVNGVDHTLVVDNRWNLADVLRERLGLTGTKVGCDRGECGACAVLVDGVPMQSCTMLAAEMGGKKITTIEGIGTPTNLHKIQAALVKNMGTQCGVCAPGIVVVSKALFDRKPKPTADEIKQELAGNLCKCGHYPLILKSLLEVT